MFRFLAWITAVSYTHLDVYKRQVYNKPSAANPFDTPGGHVVSVIRQMNTDNRKLLIDKLKSVVATGQTPLTEVMYEAYL